MIRTYKFKKEDKVLLGSDFHLCHAKDFILGPRGYFNSTGDEQKDLVELKRGRDQYRRDLIESINEQSDNETTIIHLGDAVVGAGQNGLEELESFLNQIVFKEIYLFAGNHPSGWSKLATEAAKQKEVTYWLMDEFGRVPFEYNGRTIYFIPNNQWDCFFGKQYAQLNHYPVGSWNNMGRNGFMLHGHTHRGYEKGRHESISGGKILDVGVENALAFSGRKNFLFSVEDIRAIMEKKKYEQVDHH